MIFLFLFLFAPQDSLLESDFQFLKSEVRDFQRAPDDLYIGAQVIMDTTILAGQTIKLPAMVVKEYRKIEHTVNGFVLTASGVARIYATSTGIEKIKMRRKKAIKVSEKLERYAFALVDPGEFIEIHVKKGKLTLRRWSYYGLSPEKLQAIVEENK